MRRTLALLLLLLSSACDNKSERALAISMARFADAAQRGELSVITYEFGPIDDELRLSNRTVDGRSAEDARKKLRAEVAKLLTANWAAIRDRALEGARTRRLPATDDEWARERDWDTRETRVMAAVGEADARLLKSWQALARERDAVVDQRLAERTAAAVDAGAGKVLLVARDGAMDLTACLRDALVMELAGDWAVVRDEPVAAVKASAAAVVHTRETYATAPHTFVVRDSTSLLAAGRNVTEQLVDGVSLEVTVSRAGRPDARWAADATADEARLRSDERSEAVRKRALSLAACPKLKAAPK